MPPHATSGLRDTSPRALGSPRRRASVLAFAFLIGCAGIATTPEGQRYTSITPFSAVEPGEKLPQGWRAWSLSRFKRDTQYRLVKDGDGVTVVEAVADGSASGLVKQLDVDLARTPWLSWRWRVPAPIFEADNQDRAREDSPARIVVTFEGDGEKLDIEERAIAARVKALTGREMPYATLMYILENRLPVEDVIESAHTSRVRMLVVQTGVMEGGRWLTFQRNVAEDYRRVFGEAPGRIQSIGILTDTDNTGGRTQAYYGDIKFSAARPTHPVRHPVK